MVSVTDWIRHNLPVKVLALVGLFAIKASAAELAPVTIDDFSPGLVTEQDSSSICDGCAQDLKNVDVSSGKLEKRRGTVLQNASTVGGFSSQAVRFAMEYPDSTPTFWILALTSASWYKSNDSGATWTSLTSTHGFTTTSRAAGVNAFGRARLTDGTTNWITFNGSVVGVSTASPKGTAIEFWKRRIWVATSSVLNASAVDDPEDWTADEGTDDDAAFFYIRQSDGYSIRAVKQFKGELLIFKDFTLDSLRPKADGLTYTQVGISDSIGCQYPESIVERENDIIWLGQDGYYSYNGSVIVRISDPIDRTVDTINQLNSFSRSWVQTLQSDWEAGTIGEGITATVSAGDLLFSTAGVSFDTFADGNFTASPAWSASSATLPGGTASISGGQFDFVTTGSATFSGASFTYGVSSPTFLVQADVTGLNVENAGAGGEGVMVLSTNSVSGLFSGYALFFTIDTDASDGFGLWQFDSDALGDNIGNYNTSMTTGTAYVIGMTVSSGVVTVSLNGTNVISAVDSSYSAFSSVHLGLGTKTSTTSANYRFDNIRISTGLGTFLSQSFNIGTAVTSWGNFTAGDVDNGGDITYSVYTDTNSSLTIGDSATWVSSQTITSGSSIVLATSAFVAVRATFTRTAQSQTPTLSDFLVAWNEGSSNFPVWSVWHEGDYLSAVSIDSTSVNDTILVYDRNGAWTRYKDLSPYCFFRFRNKPYMGSALQGDVVRIQADGVLNDYTGSAISSYWTSKDFTFGQPLTNKVVHRYFVTGEYASESDALFEWGVNRGSLTSESDVNSAFNGTLDLDSVSGWFRKTIQPQSMTYKRGLSHRFKISDSDLSDEFSILSVTFGRISAETDP